MAAVLAPLRRWFPPLLRRGFCAEAEASQIKGALASSEHALVGVGRLAAKMPSAFFPMPKPFGVHVVRGFKVPDILRGCTSEVWLDSIKPEDELPEHCKYAVQHEFPWFPLFVGMANEPQVRDAVAEAILPLAKEGVNMARRWWFVYEMFFQRLPLDDSKTQQLVPFLPPERFFCTNGVPSLRHGVLDNLLGNRDFCPFVQKFAGAEDASQEFQAELLEVLSPICMMTIKEFLHEAGLEHSSPVDQDKFDQLIQQLVDGGFVMNEAEKLEFKRVFGLLPDSSCNPLVASGIVEFAQWLRTNGRLAMRLREHLLGVAPTDLRWHAPGEQFLERLSRVISSIETRASQMIENELPPERKERFFVDEISKPWERDNIKIDAALIVKLQRGLLSQERYEHVIQTQVPDEPRRTTQNWVSSEKYDDMVGKAKVVHHLPPPPEVLGRLLDEYFLCLDRMMNDSSMNPIVSATIAKVAFNVLHPLVDGNGRVQRMLFQLVLFKFGFLPRMNVPVSVIMLQDRTGYEIMQQKHVDQLMAGASYIEAEDEKLGDTFRHVEPITGIEALYCYQDFTFAVSSMMKLLQGTLPVIAAKAYFLARFDWRVDELLKGDALLPPRAATKIAKVFKNDGPGFSFPKLAKLFFLDGWSIGFKRILRFLTIARRPEDMLGLVRLRQACAAFFAKSQRRLWIMTSGQQLSSSSTGRVRWVGISLTKFDNSSVALKRALAVSKPGDTVVAVHYPSGVDELLSQGLFPQLATDFAGVISEVRNSVLSKVNGIVEDHKPPDVLFQAFVGGTSEYKPAYALCEDAKVAEVKPYRIYVGYDEDEHHRAFTDYIVRNAPCDVAIIKEDSPKQIVRWVGISSRNFNISGSALIKAFAHSHPGDTVVGVHYPTNPFVEEGLSSVYERHFTSGADAEGYLDLLVGSMHSRALERAGRLAETYAKDGVNFTTRVGPLCAEPHRFLVQDAKAQDKGREVSSDGSVGPNTLYVGYSQRRDRNLLVEPGKLYDVVEYVVRNAPCNVVVVKETQEEMAERIRKRKKTELPL